MNRRSVAGVFLLALLVHLASIFEQRELPGFSSPLVDAYTYDRTAREIAESGPRALGLPYYQPPLYPLLLGATYAVTGGSHLAPRVLQAIGGALTAALVFLLAGRWKGPRVAWVASMLFALYGPVLYLETKLLPPSLLLLLNGAALLLLLEADERPSGRGRPWIAGLLLGLSAIARPTSLLLAAGALVWWVRGAGAARRKIAAIFGAAVLVPVLPVTVANVVGGGELILVSWNGGINFYLGNGENSESLTAIQPGHAWDALQLEPRRAGVESHAAESGFWFRRGLREAVADPLAWTVNLGRKTIRLLDARETPRNTDYEDERRDSRILSLPLPGFGLVAPLAFLGFVARGSRSRTRALLGWALAAVALENLLFFVTGRYRVAAVPALCVLAGAGVDAALRERVRAFSGPALASAVAFAALVHVDLLGERAIDEARAELNRGIALRRLGLDASASRHFQNALVRAPDDPDVHRAAGELALADGRPEIALGHFARAAELAPGYLRALLGQAQCLERLGRGSEAEPVYREALAADPWSAAVRLNYGVHLALAGRTEEARRMFEEGIALGGPERERLLLNLRRLEAGS